MKSVYLIIAHGSREKKANEDFLNFLEAFRAAYPHRIVEAAFLELSKPDIPHAMENCISCGATEIFVIPLMLFSGRHVTENIPKFIQEAKAKYPQVNFHYAGPLTDHPMMLHLLEEKAKMLKEKS